MLVCNIEFLTDDTPNSTKRTNQETFPNYLEPCQEWSNESTGSNEKTLQGETWQKVRLCLGRNPQKAIKWWVKKKQENLWAQPIQRSSEFISQLWNRDKHGFWYPAHDYNSEAEEEDKQVDKLGNAEPSEKEGRQE